MIPSNTTVKLVKLDKHLSQKFNLVGNGLIKLGTILLNLQSSLAFGDANIPT